MQHLTVQNFLFQQLHSPSRNSLFNLKCTSFIEVPRGPCFKWQISSLDTAQLSLKALHVHYLSYINVKIVTNLLQKRRTPVKSYQQEWQGTPEVWTLFRISFRLFFFHIVYQKTTPIEFCLTVQILLLQKRQDIIPQFPTRCTVKHRILEHEQKMCSVNPPSTVFI